jgi:hypothetical protein
MESLAGIFISLITLVNSVAPATHISQRLAVYPLSNSSSTAVLSDEDETVIESTPAATSTTSESRQTRKNEQLEKAREQRKKVEEAAKKRREEIKAKVESKREELKEKLESIKDENKKKIVEHLGEMMASKNEKWTSHWNTVLTRLTEILAKVEERGGDVALAKAAITEAQAAVTAQSAKTYTISVTTEAKLREDVSPTATQFKADLKATQEKVKDAREAVHAAFKSIKVSRSPKPDSSPLSSPLASPTGGENE